MLSAPMLRDSGYGVSTMCCVLTCCVLMRRGMCGGRSRSGESRMMPAYLEQGLLKRNPFETIDQTGVGELVRIAAERGRDVKPDLKLGVCGEHGGDPDSIALFYDAGLDYVSCSPFRVPIARLAAAQAVLSSSG